ncbi:mitochondrial carrier domain-containing protein [Catenaria anguillulae PL171]|uniref:Mitochondrial carrier domain-containing protein n=1 Tax=Catenaria anguillulae PL171 TaxID=765915 RepID=A0A1Y2H8F8_9FUNG|nr:mitochondrial carrier domain-containing protein [Catenaria anguillulae PL171]
MASKGSTTGKASFTTTLIAGGTAGLCEALVMHPLDVLKVRLQLQPNRLPDGQPRLGFVGMAAKVARRDGILGFYKGLGAVVIGIVPKMAVRFTSFNYYKGLFADKETAKLQAQRHSLSDPLAEVTKYRNPIHAAYTIVKDEGPKTLWKGAANFAVYNEGKRRIEAYQGHEMHSWQQMLLGLVSGAMGPISNNPIDTIKTRVQRSLNKSGETGFGRIKLVMSDMWKNEGLSAFYKGLTPRLLRVAPGNAVTFTVYEIVSKRLQEGKKNNV